MDHMAVPDTTELEHELTSALGQWAASSVAVGSVLKTLGTMTDSPFLKGFAGQTLGWGAIDGAIAGFGKWRQSQTDVHQATGDESASPDERISDEGKAQAKADKLYKLLAFNAALDVGYVAAGVATMLAAGPLSRRTSRPASEWMGIGAGVAVQGGFLWALDATFARRVAQISAESVHSWHDSRTQAIERLKHLITTAHSQTDSE